jgi:hypothetical protein
MYSFVLKAHQKVDSIAYRHLSTLLGKPPLMPLDTILHFEGPRGPDATRLKKDGNTAPWHFYEPFNKDDQTLLKVIDDHEGELVKALKLGDDVRGAFEAAWLAHALVDGLTPAHHFPYEAGLEELRASDKSSRDSVGEYFIVKGETRRDTIKRSYQLIGPKGLLTTHTSFEAGAAMIILPLHLSNGLPTEAELARLKSTSVTNQFELLAQEIESFHLYERFIKRGWTRSLARDVRRELAPRMVRMVTLAWYDAFETAGLTGTKPHAHR